jgi:Flp pilus assembly protein TadD
VHPAELPTELAGDSIACYLCWSAPHGVRGGRHNATFPRIVATASNGITLRDLDGERRWSWEGEADMSDSGTALLHDEGAAAECWRDLGEMPDVLRILDELDRQAGRADHALQTIARSISRNATNPQFFYGLACTLQQRRRWHHAADHFRRAIQIQPSFLEAYLGLAAVLREMRQESDARDALRHALDFAPADARVQAGLAALSEARGQFALTIEQLRRAVALDSSLAEGWSQLGCLLQQRGETAEASACFTRALQHWHPGPQARLAKAMLALRVGDFAAGWADFELRLADASATHAFPIPHLVWDETTLARQTVLVRSEGNTADDLLFASCLPDLLQRVGHAWIECDASLHALFERSFPTATILQRLTHKAGAADWYRAASAPDAQIHCGSLPRYLRPSLAAFPQHAGYLAPDSERVRRYQQRLAALGGGPKVGISWRGAGRALQGAEPMPPLAAWDAVLRVPNLHFISLQRDDCAGDVQDLAERQGTIIHSDFVAPGGKDADDLAALIAALDLVITVPNLVANLTGALGVPGWTLLPGWPSWRWMMEGDRTPWYPSLRLYRQGPGRRWEDVLGLLGRDLKRITPWGRVTP